MSAIRYTRIVAVLALPLASASSQSRMIDGAISTRLRPGPDDRTRFETELRGALQPSFAFGVGMIAGGSASTVSRLGASVGQRYDARVGPSVRGKHAAASVFVGGSKLTGARATNATNLLGARVELRLASVNFTLSGEETDYTAPHLTAHDTVYVVAGFPFYSARTRLEPGRHAYSQLAADVSWTRGALTWSATIGARSSRSVSAERWGTARTEVRFEHGLSLVGEIGQVASVPEQQLRAARHASLALRFVPSTSLDARASILESRDGAAARLTVIRDSSGVAGLRVTGVRAASVELMSDLTDWTPVVLRSRGGNTWTLDRRLPAGVYRVVIRVDSGPWLPPPDVPTTRSEFGDPVGVLVVQP